MRLILLCTFAIAAAMGAFGQDTGSVRTADGFQCPVGPNGSGEGYYIARGYLPNGHLGDDWNGIKGGDTDLGDPVYSTAHGLVVFAKNYHVGWGNVVIIRHAYYEGLTLKYVDSLYGHLNDFNVQEGQQVRRGQLIGHIGNNRGMYDAHLHFEMRKNLNIGMYRSSFPRDFSNYYSPNRFIAAHPTCPRGDKTVAVPINTFPANAPPSYAGTKVRTPVYTPRTAPASHLPPVVARSGRPARVAPEPTVVTTPPSYVKVETPSSAPRSVPKAAASTAASTKSSLPALTPKRTASSASKSSTTTAAKPAAPTVLAPTKSAIAGSGALDDDAYDSPEDAEAPPPGSPIRRSQTPFRVDRFPDLRGFGY